MEIGLNNRHTVFAVSMLHQNREGGDTQKRENGAGRMKKAPPYIEESTKHTTDLYKMGTLVSEKMVADATEPLI